MKSLHGDDITVQSSVVLLHAEAAPPAAGLGGSGGEQRISATHRRQRVVASTADLLHQDVAQPIQRRQPHVSHQARGEDGGDSVRVVQLGKVQGVQAEGRGHQGGHADRGGEGVWRQRGQEGRIQRGGGGGGAWRGV